MHHRPFEQHVLVLSLNSSTISTTGSQHSTEQQDAVTTTQPLISLADLAPQPLHCIENTGNTPAAIVKPAFGVANDDPTGPAVSVEANVTPLLFLINSPPTRTNDLTTQL